VLGAELLDGSEAGVDHQDDAEQRILQRPDHEDHHEQRA